MKHKFETAEKIQDYVRKTKFKKISKIIRSDQDREYVNASLKKKEISFFFRKKEIEMQYIVAIYTGTKWYSVEKASDESSISDENDKVYAD